MILKVMIASACVLCIVLMGIVAYSYKECFYFAKKKRRSLRSLYRKYKERGEKEICNLITNLFHYEYENVEITSHDGIKLCGKYFHVRDDAPVEIGFHGYKSNSMRDFCGGAELCFEKGINLLLVDQRAHGKSGGRTISFGVNERLDCKKWVNYVSERFGKDTKIILTGVSMGASTILMASELDIDKNVRCIVADCPYSDQSKIIKRICAKRKYSPRFVYPFIKFSAKVFGRFNLESCSPLAAVKKTKIPILFIHGLSDGYVPSEMSKELYDACASEKQLLFVPGADHAMSFATDENKYRKTVFDFYDKHLK